MMNTLKRRELGPEGDLLNKKLIDAFGARSYQSLVRDEVVFSPAISQEARLVEAIHRIQRMGIPESEAHRFNIIYSQHPLGDSGE